MPLLRVALQPAATIDIKAMTKMVVIIVCICLLRLVAPRRRSDKPIRSANEPLQVKLPTFLYQSQCISAIFLTCPLFYDLPSENLMHDVFSRQLPPCILWSFSEDFLKDERRTSNAQHRTSNNDVASLRNLISFVLLFLFLFSPSTPLRAVSLLKIPSLSRWPNGCFDTRNKNLN